MTRSTSEVYWIFKPHIIKKRFPNKIFHGRVSSLKHYKHCLCYTIRLSSKVALQSMTPADTSKNSAAVLNNNGQSLKKCLPPPTFKLVTTIYINVFKAGFVSLQYMFENTVHILNLSDYSITSKMYFIVHLHAQNRKIFYFFPTFCTFRTSTLYLETNAVISY